MQNEEVNPLLILKYIQPVPRYTSYPTVPYWKEELDVDAWINFSHYKSLLQFFY
jgi:oxygen-independent coproporphyrinogen-3 oxidase